MKPFEFITEEEWELNISSGNVPFRVYGKDVNKLLNEKAVIDFARVYNNRTVIGEPIHNGIDTHVAFVFLREIEEEKSCPCRKMVKFIADVREHNKFDADEIAKSLHNFCPDCGANLQNKFAPLPEHMVRTDSKEIEEIRRLNAGIGVNRDREA